MSGARRARDHRRARPRADWRRGRYAVLDLETTGLDAAVDGILAAGLVPVVDGRLRLAERRLLTADPGVAPRAEAVRVHRIRPVDVRNAPPLPDLVAGLRTSLEGAMPVAWTAWVEAAFLSDALGGSEASWRRRIVDVRLLAREVDRRAGIVPSPARDERLASCARRFGVPPDEDHDALADAYVTAQLFVVLATRLDAKRPSTLRRLGT